MGTQRKSDTAEDVDLELRVLMVCATEMQELSAEAAARVVLYLSRRFVQLPPMQRIPLPSLSSASEQCLHVCNAHAPAPAPLEINKAEFMRP